ncbi:MAG: proline--tRNA ligase [Elusimicrobiota bacterium]|nr:proline--tRNA ligase [Elusimicrobiota bacterium]
MKLSQYFLPTFRETPSDADTVSCKLMIRSGMIRKLSSGIYEWLPLGVRVLKKVEQIVREEMTKIGGQEIMLPFVLPKELWEETGRWQLYGKELLRLKDRKDAEFCLGPTHEEIVTDIVRKQVRSYKQLPLMLYQFGIKFRDEIRPRFGVMRAREFYMKDAYSFHTTEEDAERYYKEVFDAYSKICERCGFKYRAVEALTGAIGGKFSHEFMVLSQTGEEEIVYCSSCGYAANVEKAECIRNELRLHATNGVDHYDLQPLEEVHTPNMKTVEEVGKFLNAPPDKFIKSLVYLSDNKPVMILIRGDYGVNESKLKEYLASSELTLADAQMIEKVTGAPLGFAGPVNLLHTIYDLRILADYSVENITNAISGANKKYYHLKNININRDYQPAVVTDLRKITRDDPCPRCKKSLEFSHGIEIGHTFKLGTKYSKSMKATFLDAKGIQQYFVMGCYGIGVSRIVAAAIEQSHDENGIIWNIPLAPFEIILLPVDYKDEKIRNLTDRIYSELVSKNYDVLLDDRDERPGVKFKDADLIGIPVRITVSSRHLPDKVELKLRKDPAGTVVKIENLGSELEKIFHCES